ncbi:MAG: tetratricopeptide repeat protein [Ignavibacteria bacterium]|nr:tetratricopeptide repeat protein [Ignavibacteria bacterium]
MNQLVGKRYFEKDRLYYRKGSHDYFEVNKQPNTIRIFCFGESTTAGFPYEYNAIPSEFLRDRLLNAFPDKNIEVINTAIAATNSFTVSEFVNELSHYKPDLFIVYMGQNEFYGVYGVASTISIGKNRWIIKTYLWLQQFKTFLLLKNIINSVSNFFKSDSSDKDELLMEQMVQNNSIGYNSSDYKTAVNTFKENYEEIIELAKENRIPIIVSTLVTNEKDLVPFVSSFSNSLSDTLKNKWKEFYDLGINSLNNNNYQSAINYFEKSISIDSTPASVHYQIGKCYETLKNYNEAKREFLLAKDLDGLRFRAPSDFNYIIRQLANKFKVPLADVNKAFRENSTQGIIGNELLIDHLHPNISGYFLLAKSWFKTIKDNKIFKLSPDIVLDDNLLWQQSSFTMLDSAIGELKIMKLKNEPPFSSVSSNFDFTPENSIEQIAYDYAIKQQMSWGKAHLMAAKEYIDKNDFEHALKEYKAILITDEKNPYILTSAGDMYFNLKLYPSAEENYLKAFSILDEPTIKFKLGITCVNLQKSEIAIQLLKNCLMINNLRRFTTEEIEKIHYNLALAYIQLNEYNNAILELNIILKNNPLNIEAKALLIKLGR